MTWEYRVCKERHSSAAALLDLVDEDERVGYTVRQVHYWNDDPEKIYLISAEEVAPYGSSKEEIEACLKLMLRAATKPIIDLDTLTFYEPTEEEQDDVIEFTPDSTSFFDDGPI